MFPIREPVELTSIEAGRKRCEWDFTCLLTLPQAFLIVFCSVYGDLNWYLQSRAAPTVRPRPLQQLHPQQHQLSTSLRSVLSQPLHHSPSAFTPSTSHSHIREMGAGIGGRASLANPVAKPSGNQETSSSVHSEVPDQTTAEVIRRTPFLKLC